MVFHSFSYLLFFPIVFAVYYLLPTKARIVWLLAASYFFYGYADIRYVILLLAITLLAYGSGLAIERAALLQKAALAKGILVITILGNLGILGYFKYVNFLLDNLNKIMTLMSFNKQFAQRNGLLALGISFILFQSISYSVDVYRKDLPAEKNILHFALYLAFFPKLISGPLERTDAVLKQIREPKNFSLTALKEGLSLLLLGLFYKLVLSDNIASVINPVLEAYADYSGLEIALAVILFAFQIYGDFGGYSLMAIGSAKALGFELHTNFDAPYHAESVAEFWRRWHITLNDWLRDYLYIPLGGNRKGTARKYLNTMIVFLLSGLWHGADWSFVIWGGLNGLYIVAEGLFAASRSVGKRPDTVPFSTHLRRKITTFLLVDFAWLFFCMPDVQSAFGMIFHAITSPGIRELFTLRFLEIFPNTTTLIVILAALLLLLFIDTVIYRQRTTFQSLFFRQSSAFRWIFSIILLLMIIFFGAYGEAYEQTQFIYFQF
ncbi:MAG: MBOAT family protein [Lachnospiraceae bacterium]|nr:MBOAT family protein [Lachnospiraceae bacterium]